MRMKIEDTGPDNVAGFFWPVKYDWLVKNVKPGLSGKSWQFYCDVLLRARREQDPRVIIPARGPNAARMSATTLREVVRNELESKLLLRITRDNNASPYVYRLLDPREPRTGAELRLRVQRRRLAEIINKRYPVRDYTADEIGRVATFLLPGRLLRGADETEFSTVFYADNTLAFACPFHTGGKSRENKLRIALNSGKWWCEYNRCQHGRFLAEDIGRSLGLRGGNGYLPHLVTALRYERDRATGDHRTHQMLAGQGREVIEQILAGRAASVHGLTFTDQNPQTRELIPAPYVRPASLSAPMLASLPPTVAKATVAQLARCWPAPVEIAAAEWEEETIEV